MGKDSIFEISAQDHAEPLAAGNQWMTTFSKIKRLPGPRFEDGSINWQCPCMAGGSLVAHKCGHLFRKLYICMSENDHEDVTIKCPEQFIDWSSCMQNLSATRREQMRRALLDETTKSSK